MVSFGIDIKNGCSGVSKYLEDFKARNEAMNFKHWDFKMKKVSSSFFVFSFKPIYPKVYFVSIPIFIILLILVGWTNWLLIPIFFIVPVLFWMPKYYFLMTKLGLKKKGLKADIRFVNSFEVVERCLNWDK